MLRDAAWRTFNPPGFLPVISCLGLTLTEFNQGPASPVIQFLGVYVLPHWAKWRPESGSENGNIKCPEQLISK